jgi:hypothetical protein
LFRSEIGWFCERWEDEKIWLIIEDEDQSITIGFYLNGEGCLIYKNPWKLADGYAFGGFWWYY